MQGAVVIRWSGSVLLAITLHTACWFWADQILPPAIAASTSPQRLTISLATRITAPFPATEVVEEAQTVATQAPMPKAQSPILPQIKKAQEQPLETAAITSALSKHLASESLKSEPVKTPTKPVEQIQPPSSETPHVPAAEPVTIRPKRKPTPPVRKQVVKKLPPLEAKPVLTAQKQPRSQETPTTTHAPDAPSPRAKTVPTSSRSLQETSVLSKDLAPVTTANTSASASIPIVSEVATFKDLPLIVEPAFSKPPKPPQYPKRARRKKIQGQVILRARVDEQGLVEDIVIWQSSGHKLLDKAAEKAMWGWQFTPAKQAGIRTASWVEFPVNFAIR